MSLGEVSEPELVAGAVRIRVAAAGVNRADLMQRQGMYPPPPGASEILGLECAGEVLEVASDVTRFRPGDRAMALLTGGGYRPFRWSRSARLTAVATTRIRIEPGCSSGAGASPSFMTDGSPGSSNRMALTARSVSRAAQQAGPRREISARPCACPRGARPGTLSGAGGGWRIAGGQPPSAGGKSGLHKVGRSLTATRGNPRESATETKPPMADEA